MQADMSDELPENVNKADVIMLGGLVFLVPVIGIVIVVGKAGQASMKLARPQAAYLPVDSFTGVLVADLSAVALITLTCFAAGFTARNTLAGRLVPDAETRLLWKIPGNGFVTGLTDGIGGSNAAVTMIPVLARHR